MALLDDLLIELRECRSAIGQVIAARPSMAAAAAGSTTLGNRLAELKSVIAKAEEARRISLTRISNMQEFNYEVVYHGADGQSAICTGTVEVQPGDFQKSFESVMRKSFQQITQGKAVYGQPGKGCRGPYQITRFLLQQKADA